MKNESVILDVRKLLCPLPVIRLQNLIKTLKAGSTIAVIATDPGVLEDIPTWCRIQGHTVLEIQKKDREIHIEVLIGVDNQPN